jgi:hypothetical protein
VPGDRPHVEPWSLTAAATEEKIGWIREAVGAREDVLVEGTSDQPKLLAKKIKLPPPIHASLD